MERKLVLTSIIVILLASLLGVTFRVEKVQASGTIYIRADGSIDPPTANITTTDNVTYTFTDNNYDEIVVERSNIIIDGNGCKLQSPYGYGFGYGFSPISVTNVTIKNTTITDFYFGIHLNSSSQIDICKNTITGNYFGIGNINSSNCRIFENTVVDSYTGISLNGLSGSMNCIVARNNVTANYYGINLAYTSNFTIVENYIFTNYWYGINLHGSSNTISGNIVKSNENGISLWESANNTISRNNITNNTYGISVGGGSTYNSFIHNNFVYNMNQTYETPDPSIWDDGCEGNFWSDYNGNDSDGDRIGDTPYVIDENNQDNYPLMHPYGPVCNLNTDLTYAIIQSAIDAPETLNGHSIFVRNGIYYENVIVDKSLSLIGEDKHSVKIDGNFSGTVVAIEASNVTITGFNMQNGLSDGVHLSNSSYNSISGNNIASNNWYGIYLGSSSNYNTLSDNNITANGHTGVFLAHSSNNTISGNSITSNNYDGVYLSQSSHNTVSGNNIISNNLGGVTFYFSSYNSVSGNNITNNSDEGVDLYSSSNNSVSGNNITDNDEGGVILDQYSNYNIISGNNIALNNDEGVRLYYSSNYNIISGNNITNNSYEGVYLLLSSNYNIVSGNNITSNNAGVVLTSSSNNVISGNNVTDNTLYDFWLSSSPSTIIYHNSLANNLMIFLLDSSNTAWDNGCEGNFWSDFAVSDSNGDGIGDTPYIIDGSNQDNYPLMNPYWNPADINHDLKVDIFDVVLACAAYSSIPSDLNWNCHCDIAEPSAVINIFDIVIICSSYGEEYVP